MKKMKQKAKRFSVILITAIIAIGCLGCISAAAFTKTEKSTYKGLTKTQKYSAKDACAIMAVMKRQTNIKYSCKNDIGRGVMYWCNAHEKDLLKKAKKQKVSWKSATFQRKYIKSDFGKYGINKKLKKASSLNGKVNVINKHYIRPYDLKRENKECYKYAKKYYDGRSKLK